MTEHLYAAIMAGGGGTRLWPMSRRERPKQSLRLIGDQTLFQMAMQRLEPLIPIDRSLILTIREQSAQLKGQVPVLNDANFILEPGPRGTASVIGLAAIHLRKRDPEAVMACLTADHYIPSVDSFQNLLEAGYDLARENHLVTLGISPTSPDTGYGYIHRGSKLATAACDCYTVEAFTEKPDLKTAKSYLKSGEYFWNSGMFIWQVDVILNEIKRQLPDLFDGLMEIENVIGTDDAWNVTEQVWAGLENITIDYGVMERAEGVVVLRADDLGWIDVGDWGRLFDILPHDAFDNVLVAEEVRLLDSNGVLIYQDQESSQRLITGIGLSDMVIIDTGDALFACHRAKAAELKQLIEKLKQSDLDRYL